MPIQNPIRSYPANAPRGLHSDPEPARDWEIMLCGDLTDKEVELTDRLMGVPRRSRGTIFFDSCGGSTYVGLSLAVLIRLRGLKARAVVAGECSSAALLPFAACEERFVLPFSTLLFHPVRWHSEENVRVEEATEWARHFKELEPTLDGLLARLFGCDVSLLDKWTRPGRFVSGQEMADAGLAKLVDLFSGDVWSQMSSDERP